MLKSISIVTEMREVFHIMWRGYFASYKVWGSLMVRYKSCGPLWFIYKLLNDLLSILYQIDSLKWILSSSPCPNRLSGPHSAPSSGYRDLPWAGMKPTAVLYITPKPKIRGVLPSHPHTPSRLNYSAHDNLNFALLWNALEPFGPISVSSSQHTFILRFSYLCPVASFGVKALFVCHMPCISPLAWSERRISWVVCANEAFSWCRWVVLESCCFTYHALCFTMPVINSHREVID
jgi:hypothetical protein